MTINHSSGEKASVCEVAQQGVNAFDAQVHGIHAPVENIVIVLCGEEGRLFDQNYV